jgi:hypothetical protein
MNCMQNNLYDIKNIIEKKIDSVIVMCILIQQN